MENTVHQVYAVSFCVVSTYEIMTKTQSTLVFHFSFIPPLPPTYSIIRI